MIRRGKLALLASLYVALTACAGSMVVGPPIAMPETQKKTFALWPKFTPVDSTTPRLSWEGFPDYQLARAEGDAQTTAMLGKVNNVRYEVRIWEELNRAPSALVYQQKGIAGTEHVVSQPLKPARRYFWSVRATFDVGGARRMTPWAQVAGIMKNRSVPNPACYRFETP
jgi:hypothetical protein